MRFYVYVHGTNQPVNFDNLVSFVKNGISSLDLQTTVGVITWTFPDAATRDAEYNSMYEWLVKEL